MGASSSLESGETSSLLVNEDPPRNVVIPVRNINPIPYVQNPVNDPTVTSQPSSQKNWLKRKLKGWLKKNREEEEEALTEGFITSEYRNKNDIMSINNTGVYQPPGDKTFHISNLPLFLQTDRSSSSAHTSSTLEVTDTPTLQRPQTLPVQPIAQLPVLTTPPDTPPQAESKRLSLYDDRIMFKMTDNMDASTRAQSQSVPVNLQHTPSSHDEDEVQLQMVQL